MAKTVLLYKGGYLVRIYWNETKNYIIILIKFMKLNIQIVIF